MLTSRGLGTVLGDLAKAGYDAAWLVLGADDVGAPHVRKRIWILAHDTDSYGVPGTEQGGQYDRSEEFAGGGTDNVAAGHCVEDSSVERLDAHGVFGGGSAAEAREGLPADAGRTGEDVSDSRSVGRHERAIRDQGERKGAFMALDRRGEDARTRALFNASCLGREAKSVETGDACQTLAEEAREQFSGASGRQVSPWRAEPDVGRVADGVAARVDRLKAIGNGQVPLVAATAFRILKQELNKHLK